MSAPLLKPSVYQEKGTDGLPDHPAFLGGKCTCGYVFFPMQTYGCEKCGRYGDDLKPVPLSGQGKVVSSALVHLHAGNREAPFFVSAVELDDGPVVRTLMESTDHKVKPGDRVITALVDVTDPETGDVKRDLRFRKV